jgi:hypothetical protein
MERDDETTGLPKLGELLGENGKAIVGTVATWFCLKTWDAVAA